MCSAASLFPERVIFPGSFDPLTLGHLDIIRRSLGIFERLTVAVLSNSNKQELFSVDERLALIRAELSEYGERVNVEAFSGLLVEYARSKNAKVIIRGLRAITDYDYEAQMALMNKELGSEIETFFLMTSAEYSYVSSTLARQVARFGGNVSSLVSKTISEALSAKYAEMARS